jgi:hypothetical protein
MLRLDFERPLSALEIRDPAVEVCREAASEFGLYARFSQSRQRAFDGYNGQKDRKRIGNGKHKNWMIRFQAEEPNV